MRANEYSELTAFIAVAEERSFRRAGERLSLSASTLSHAVRALEQRLDVRLLNRSTRAVSLTDAGSALLGTIGPAFQSIDAAVASLNAGSAAPRGSVRINIPHLAAHIVLGGRFAAFAQAYPDVVLDVGVNDAFVDIVASGFDAGIRLGDSVDKDMIATRVSADLRIAVVGSPDYFARHPAPIDSPADLRAHLCIGYRATGTRQLYPWEFENDGAAAAITPAGPLIVDAHDLLVDAALSGAGLAYAIESQVEAQLADGRLMRVLAPWCPSFPGFYLYYPSRRQMPSALRALIDFLRLQA
jgi:DNA-binding transcriptional LysR family regulator